MGQQERRGKKKQLVGQGKEIIGILTGDSELELEGDREQTREKSRRASAPRGEKSASSWTRPPRRSRADSEVSPPRNIPRREGGGFERAAEDVVMTISIPALLILIVIAAVCGAVGKAIAGSTRGGLIVSIVLGFIGALLGPWVAGMLKLLSPSWSTSAATPSRCCGRSSAPHSLWRSFT